MQPSATQEESASVTRPVIANMIKWLLIRGWSRGSVGTGPFGPDRGDVSGDSVLRFRVFQASLVVGVLTRRDWTHGHLSTAAGLRRWMRYRSEEHTSELQSPMYLV